MKPLLVLLIGFAISLVAIKIITKTYDYKLAARIAMSLMLLFTAFGHFVFTKGMTMMIPEIIPYKELIVYATGFVELSLAIGILITKYSSLGAWVLIIFFIVLLPANIYAAIHNINYQNGTFDGHGLSYLWFRIPLQILFIFWTYCSTIRF